MLRHWLLCQPLAQRQIHVADLTTHRQQTSLGSDKIVIPESLRSIECGAPGISFSASISALVPDEIHSWFRSYLLALCAAVKSMGGDRARGLGRCKIKLKGSEKSPIKWPGAMPASLQKLANASSREVPPC